MVPDRIRRAELPPGFGAGSHPFQGRPPVVGDVVDDIVGEHLAQPIQLPAVAEMTVHLDQLGDDGTEPFDRWHASMRSTAAQLLGRAQQAGAVRPDPTVGDLLALAGGAALAATNTRHALLLLRDGLTIAN